MDTKELRFFQGLCNDNPAVIKDIYEKYVPMVKRVIKETEVARDILQESLIVIWSNYCPNDIKRFRSFGGLLIGIVKKKYSKYKNGSNQPDDLIEWIQKEYINEAENFDPLLALDEEREKRAEEEQKLKVFKMLSENCQQVLMLRYGYKKRSKEVAKIMEIAPNAVDQNVHYCSQRWRKLWEEHNKK